MDPSNENPSGGVPTTSNLYEPEHDTSNHNETKSGAVISSSSAISSHGDSTDLCDALALQPDPEGSTRTGEGNASNEDRADQDEKRQQFHPTSREDGGSSSDKFISDERGSQTQTGTDNDSTKGELKVMEEYSAEARLYHAYYDEVTRTHRPSTLRTRY